MRFALSHVCSVYVHSRVALADKLELSINCPAVGVLFTYRVGQSRAAYGRPTSCLLQSTRQSCQILMKYPNMDFSCTFWIVMILLEVIGKFVVSGFLAPLMVLADRFVRLSSSIVISQLLL